MTLDYITDSKLFTPLSFREQLLLCILCMVISINLYKLIKYKFFKAKLFVVLGNIGSGKSTLVTSLEKNWKGKCSAIQEPVSTWIKSGFLQEFYKDMCRYALSFQMYAFATRAVLYKDVDWNNIEMCFVDGHVINDRHVFVRSLNSSSKIQNNEIVWYNDIFEAWNRIVPEMDANYWIYIKTKPATCMQRIQKRGRQAEKGITIEYLTSLHTYYEELIMKQEYKDRVIIIDGDQDENTVLTMVDEIIKQKTKYTFIRSILNYLPKSLKGI
jgi:deoxyadenosine/deoxycytidine kinase